MSQELIEAVARALMGVQFNRTPETFLHIKHYDETTVAMARAALAAIEASGTHVVVPVEPTLEMDNAAFDALRTRLSEPRTVFERARDVYAAMISARPKVTT